MWYDPLLHKDDPGREIGEAAPARPAAAAPAAPVPADAAADEDMLGFEAFVPPPGSAPAPFDYAAPEPEPEQPAAAEAPKAAEAVIPTSTIDALMADPEILRASNRVIAAGQAWADQQDEKDLTDEKLKAKLTELTKEEARRNPKLPVAAVVTRGMRAISGFYGLERFLDDPRVTDVVINGCKNVMVSSFGAPKRKFVDMFPTDASTAALLAKLLKETGEDRPTVEHPRLDGQFLYKDGSTDGNLVRVNAIIGSNTVTKERFFSLRKRMTAIGDIDTLEAWTRNDDITVPAARALAAFIRHKATLIIAGATGSGKTTFLRACIREIPGDERIVTIEDSSELVLTHEDYAPLVAHGKTGIGELMENAMRMVPERIILGECRKSTEVGGFLEAINTGHDGSITTTHASSAEDALYRLLTLAAASARAGSSENFVGRQIAGGVDLVVFINAQIDPSTKSHRRKIAEIMAVDSFSGEGGPHFMLRPMFGRWSDASNPDSLPEMSAPLRCAGAGRIRHGRFWRRMMAQGMSEDEIAGLLPMEGLDANGDPAERN